MESKPLGLSDVQRDRAVGALLGLAAGDALGTGYALRPPIPADEPVGMIGGGAGPFAPGEWTGDTARAIAIAEIAATGADPTYGERLTEIVERWAWWARNAKGAGDQTGNRVLTRTVPVALANLRPHSEGGAAAGARRVAELTHPDPEVGDACVLWCLAIRHAVLTGRPDVRIGLREIDSERRDLWETRLVEAQRSRPADFADLNSWVVAAFQAAWSAIVTTRIPVDDPPAGVFAADHLRLGLEAAVRGGGHAGTVAAVAGGLLGAAYGASALPWHWRLALRGWPGLNTHCVVNLVDKILGDGEPFRFDHTYGSWRDSPPPRRHPHDDGVWLGSATSLPKVPSGAGAVVSLCRVADGHIPFGVKHLEVNLVDEVGANANLDFVLLDTVRAIEGFRADGLTVFLHGLTADGRTSAVAALYGARRVGIAVDAALGEVAATVPDSDPNREFLAALRRLAGEGGRR